MLKRTSFITLTMLTVGSCQPGYPKNANLSNQTSTEPKIGFLAKQKQTEFYRYYFLTNQEEHRCQLLAQQGQLQPVIRCLQSVAQGSESALAYFTRLPVIANLRYEPLPTIVFDETRAIQFMVHARQGALLQIQRLTQQHMLSTVPQAFTVPQPVAGGPRYPAPAANAPYAVRTDDPRNISLLKKKQVEVRRLIRLFWEQRKKADPIPDDCDRSSQMIQSIQTIQQKVLPVIDALLVAVKQVPNSSEKLYAILPEFKRLSSEYETVEYFEKHRNSFISFIERGLKSPPAWCSHGTTAFSAQSSRPSSSDELSEVEMLDRIKSALAEHNCSIVDYGNFRYYCRAVVEHDSSLCGHINTYLQTYCKAVVNHDHGECGHIPDSDPLWERCDSEMR